MTARQPRASRGTWLLAAGVAILAAFAAPASSEATILFSDDFDAGASAAWGNERGNWRASGGVYDATNPNNSPLTYTGVTTLSALTDFIVDVDVNDLDDGGIWLRSSFNGGNINGVLLVTGGKLGSFEGLYWHVFANGGAGGILNEQPVAGLQDSDAHLTVVVTGNTFQAYVNGVLVTTLVDATYGSGSVGLYDFSPNSGQSDPRGQTFDRFVVSSTAVPEPATLGLLGVGVLVAVALSRRARG